MFISVKLPKDELRWKEEQRQATTHNLIRPPRCQRPGDRYRLSPLIKNRGMIKYVCSQYRLVQGFRYWRNYRGIESSCKDVETF